MEAEALPVSADSAFPTKTNIMASSTTAPKVVGLYGLPASGKTELMKQLKEQLDASDFQFFEGSETINEFSPGGLGVFKLLPPSLQNQIRELAIAEISSICIDSKRTGIVTGHYMFWDDEKAQQPPAVLTKRDLITYTHILYLNTPVDVLVKQRGHDTTRQRSKVSAKHLKRWQDAELEGLRRLCVENGILFATLYPNLKEKLVDVILDFQRHGESHNTSVAKLQFDSVLSTHGDKVQTVLFFDADKTLAPVDTGKLFWETLNSSNVQDNPLSTLFGGPLGYSYTAFRQAMLFYEEAANEDDFNTICKAVAAKTTLYPQMFCLLHALKEHGHICPVIVTCGLRRAWEMIIAKEGLSDSVKVIGGGRVADGFVVTPEVKASLVTRAHKVDGAYTWAIGDSPVDIPMLLAAHKAIVVVGEEETRSKSMDAELLSAIKVDGLQACQVLLPNDSTTPRLDTTRLPLVDLTARSFVNSIILPDRAMRSLHLLHSTDNKAAKLLATPMRDGDIGGPKQRKAHSKAGAYLARNYVSELVGLEEFTMANTHGNDTIGYRLLHEDRTLIVPLMRGGEPMAFGVNKAFPKAQFRHAYEPQDITRQHLDGNVTVVLVDAVINNGESAVKFLQRIRDLHGSIRIVFVAGVVQNQVTKDSSDLFKLTRSMDFTVVALRISENKYTGKGSTDTGHRLFNTTHLD
ncbi:uracil phosphoribosyltransferase-domain-containing protein [Aspergillus stella-maris]|uniref:uracil phosphoribosyltransferase-domain-containing protein n=1 Tax=Aspergillus stella-maris TaxID=1810926 RepID=UPI003CCE0AC1